MHAFKIRPNAFKEIRKAILRRLLPAFGVVPLTMIVFIWLAPGDPVSTQEWIVPIIVVAGMLVFTTLNTLKRQKRMYESYRLTITEEHIMRQAFNTPDITIARKAVKEIVKAKNGAFVIFGETKLNGILIPAEVEHREEIERLLSEIKPITVKAGSGWKRALTILLLIGGMMLLCWGLLSDNIYVLTAAGLGMCGFMLFGFILIQRGKNFDNRMKRMSYVGLVPFISILAVVIMKWMGNR